MGRLMSVLIIREMPQKYFGIKGKAAAKMATAFPLYERRYYVEIVQGYGGSFSIRDIGVSL